MRTLNYCLTLVFILLTSLCWSQNDDEKKAEEYKNSISDMLGSMLQSNSKAQEAELPSSYSFDYKMLMETWEEDGERNDFELVWRKDMDQIGIIQDDNYIVVDNDQSIIATYDLKDKEVTVLPNIMKDLGSFFSNHAEVEKEKEKLTIRKTGRTKTMLGLRCEEVEVDSESSFSKNWITYDLNVSMQQLMQESMNVRAENFMDESYAKEFEGAMPVYSESTDKESGKKSYMEMKKLDRGFAIRNGDFKRVKADE